MFDTVTGCGTNELSPDEVCDADEAEVPYSDVEQPPSLSKIPTPQCQVDVTYNVVVTNGSGQDTLSLSALSDNVYGDITSVHGDIQSTLCSVGQTIAPGGNYACSFVARISSCSITVADTITATAQDDDGASYSPQGSATVVVNVTKIRKHE